MHVENTHTSIGLFEDEDLRHQWLLSTDGRRTSDEWGLLLGGLIAATDATAVDGVIASARAVPAVLHALRGLLGELFPGSRRPSSLARECVPASRC